MKKVLLTTTALVMTAGVASAEITFSGKGEAGVYRTAPTAAAVAVTAKKAAVGAATATVAGVGYATGTGLLTVTAATGASPADAVAADSDAYAVLETDVAVKLKAYNAAALAYNEVAAGDGNTNAKRDALRDAMTAAEAALRLSEAALAANTGTAAVAKGATPKLKAYSGYDFNIAASGASDNGMTFAMGFDMGAGEIADQDDDRAMDAQAGAIATSALTLGYAGYTFEIGDDKIDDLYDDTQNGDVSIAGSLGDLTFKLVTDMDDDVKAVAGGYVYTDSATAGADTLVNRAAVAAVYNPTSYSIGYTMGDVAFSMAGTEHDDRGHAAAKMSLTYTVSDALSATLSSDNVGTYKDIAKVSVTSKISDALSITASVKDDKDHALNTNTGGKQSQDVSISYTAGALSSTLATDEGSNWWVNAQYDLGGGAQAFTTFDHTEFMVAGVNFSF